MFACKMAVSIIKSIDVDTLDDLKVIGRQIDGTTVHLFQRLQKSSLEPLSMIFEKLNKRIQE